MISNKYHFIFIVNLFHIIIFYNYLHNFGKKLKWGASNRNGTASSRSRGRPEQQELHVRGTLHICWPETSPARTPRSIGTACGTRAANVVINLGYVGRPFLDPQIDRNMAWPRAHGLEIAAEHDKNGAQECVGPNFLKTNEQI